MVKFNKHHVAGNGIKARVHYSLDNRTDGRKVVTLYAKDYDGSLGKIIPDAASNDTELQSDYIVTDTVRLFENHPLYSAARARAEAIQAAMRAGA
jgi:hypothetical protein